MWIAVGSVVAALVAVAVLVRPRRRSDDDAALTTDDETRILLGEWPVPDQGTGDGGPASAGPPSAEF